MKLTKEERKEKERQRAIKREEKRRELQEFFKNLGKIEVKIKPKSTLKIGSNTNIQSKL